MQTRVLKSDALLLLTAAIWGFAFVAQRVGMEYIGPFLFNGIRFTLGALMLLLLALRVPRQQSTMRSLLWGGFAAGFALFMGSSLQQVGIVYTTAGNAGFITGLYVVLVPFFGLVLKHRIGLHNWIGALLAAAGLFFLSIRFPFSMQIGDFYVFLSAFFWAAHVHIIGYLTQRYPATHLAFLQYAVCAVLSLAVGLVFEPFEPAAVFNAGIPILYGGLLSVGVAYSLQIVGQRQAPPAHAAILLSMESVFAVIGGFMLLNETLSVRMLLGCVLMLTGMLVSQLGLISPTPENN